MSEKRTLNLFLLVDRTGSMQKNWKETISTVNAYVNELRSNTLVDLRINLSFFDAYSDAPILQQKLVSSTFWKDLSATDPSISPRGMTPLYDAIGLFARKVKEQGLKKKDLVQFVIMTDGQDTGGQEYTKEEVKKILAKFEKKQWNVTFLGANMEAFQGGDAVMSNKDNTVVFNAFNVKGVSRSLVDSTLRYWNSGATASAGYTVEERFNMIKDDNPTS